MVKDASELRCAERVVMNALRAGGDCFQLLRETLPLTEEDLEDRRAFCTEFKNWTPKKWRDTSPSTRTRAHD